MIAADAVRLPRRSALAMLGAMVVTGCEIPERRQLDFSELDGWPMDDHGAALAAFRAACVDARFPETPPPGWASLCVAASATPPSQARAFFESRFEPRLVGPEALVTGYYEPVLAGSPGPGPGFPAPLYSPPPDLALRQPHLTRAEIEAGALAGQGLELVWLADPVEAFFLQIQGSGRVVLPDGRLLRVGYAGKNGHPYTAIGRLLAERGEMALGQVSAQAIKAWLSADPARGAALMRENASFVFFRLVEGLAPEAGPIGTLGAPLAAGRSVAVDPAHYPLGLPVWIEAETAEGPLRRLTVAQDTGGAIRGPGRADLFLGTGEPAGVVAGRMRAPARMVALVPRTALP